MSKILFIGLTSFIFIMLVATSNIFATVEYEAFYMVDRVGSTTEKTTFDFNDTPSLYFRFTQETDPNTIFVLTWTSPSNDVFIEDHELGGGGVLGGWTSISSWTSSRELGLWTLDGEITQEGTPGGNLTESTNFTVVPEPISSILFVTGGTLLTGRRYIKRKKKA